MASMTKSICVVFIAAVMIVSFAPPAEAALGCGQVVSYVSSCLPYITDRGPLGSCCNGVKGLFGAARTTVDRRSACSCMKSLSSSYSGINFGKVAGIPQRCGVNIPYKISPALDCSKIG